MGDGLRTMCVGKRVLTDGLGLCCMRPLYMARLSVRWTASLEGRNNQMYEYRQGLSARCSLLMYSITEFC